MFQEKRCLSCALKTTIMRDRVEFEHICQREVACNKLAKNCEGLNCCCTHKRRCNDVTKEKLKIAMAKSAEMEKDYLAKFKHVTCYSDTVNLKTNESTDALSRLSTVCCFKIFSVVTQTNLAAHLYNIINCICRSQTVCHVK